VLRFFPFLIIPFCSIEENTLKLKHKNLAPLAHKMHSKMSSDSFPFSAQSIRGSLMLWLRKGE